MGLGMGVQGSADSIVCMYLSGEARRWMWNSGESCLFVTLCFLGLVVMIFAELERGVDLRRCWRFFFVVDELVFR